ncbi:MAG: hypothetical protein WBB01_19465 [Phormidesmis sp.]
MEAQVAAALEVSDYQQVTRLLKQWQATDPSNPLLRLYAALLQERTNRLEAAEANYLKLLKQSSSNKMMSQARAGLERIQQRQKAQKAEALEQARKISGGDEGAILAVAAPSEADRQEAIAGLAQVFNLDPYTARLKLPPSGFRLYRTGPWGEVSYYARSLKQAHIPTLTAKVSEIKALQTFQVCYFKAFTPQPTVLCKNAAGQLGTISFDWVEVSQRVSGQLPIFEQVIDLGPWGKTVHKEKVQDYAQVEDFHLAGRQIVLRLCDRLYQYQKGISLSQGNELNSRIQWNQLLSQLNRSINAPHHNDFTRFGKSALEFINLLPPIYPNLDIDRRAPSHWDQAFHLYSSLCYLNS